MWLIILILLIAGGFYVLGAKNGLPKFGYENSKKGLEERIEFLSELQAGDRITTYKFDDDEAFHYNFERNYTVIENDPVNQEITLKMFNYDELRLYDSKWFKNVMKKNESLVQTIIRRNRQRNERK